ncbi:MAG: hypothetical protein KatS3mg057_2325 [Herpetosiphonaceae bacterium]|nr:MAG: hypothetical protein KatS3mg057_2325 [Herpetosiphonaceae bacterium]
MLHRCSGGDPQLTRRCTYGQASWWLTLSIMMQGKPEEFRPSEPPHNKDQVLSAFPADLVEPLFENRCGAPECRLLLSADLQAEDFLSTACTDNGW